MHDGRKCVAICLRRVLECCHSLVEAIDLIGGVGAFEHDGKVGRCHVSWIRDRPGIMNYLFLG